MTFSTTIRRGCGPVKAPHRDRTVGPGTCADVVQEHQLLAGCAAVDGGAVDEFERADQGRRR